MSKKNNLQRTQVPGVLGLALLCVMQRMHSTDIITYIQKNKQTRRNQTKSE
jgi:hypothetical protein